MADSVKSRARHPAASTGLLALHDLGRRGDTRRQPSPSSGRKLSEEPRRGREGDTLPHSCGAPCKPCRLMPFITTEMRQIAVMLVSTAMSAMTMMTKW